MIEKLIFVTHVTMGSVPTSTHLYWGWAKENTQDQIENGTLQSISARTKAKMGSEYEKFMSDIGRKGGKAQRKTTGTIAQG